MEWKCRNCGKQCTNLKQYTFNGIKMVSGECLKCKLITFGQNPKYGIKFIKSEIYVVNDKITKRILCCDYYSNNTWKIKEFGDFNVDIKYEGKSVRKKLIDTFSFVKRCKNYERAKKYLTSSLK